MYKKIFFSILVSILYSCSKLININFEQQKPKLVVNCIFSTDKPFTLRLTKTIDYNSTNSNLVTNATCVLFCNNVVLDTFENKENGIYLSSVFPQLNKTYKLEVTCEGFQTVTAQSQIPDFPITFNYDTTHFITYDPNNGMGVYYMDAKININDNVSENNYYYIKLTNKCITGGIANPIFSYKSDDPILVSEGLLAYESGVVIFSDKMFNGKNQIINFQHVSPNVLGNDTNILISDKKALTEDYYFYLKSLIIQTNNQRDPSNIFTIGEPIEVYTNVTNGFGIFSGINSKEDTLLIYN